MPTTILLFFLAWSMPTSATTTVPTGTVQARAATMQAADRPLATDPCHVVRATEPTGRPGVSDEFAEEKDDDLDGDLFVVASSAFATHPRSLLARRPGVPRSFRPPVDRCPILRC